MLDFFQTHAYLQWVLWSLWLPTIIVWLFFHDHLRKYPKTLIKVTIGSLIFGVAWDYVAVWTNIWSYPPGCCVDRTVARLPVEEFIWIASAAVLISSLTIVFFRLTHKRSYKL